MEEVYQVWLEGFSATGQNGTAQFLGEQVGLNFRDAVVKILIGQGWNMALFDPIKISYWGCRFFDNEKDARKNFG